jgi:hypothetical protein
MKEDPELAYFFDQPRVSSISFGPKLAFIETGPYRYVSFVGLEMGSM